LLKFLSATFLKLNKNKNKMGKIRSRSFGLPDYLFHHRKNIDGDLIDYCEKWFGILKIAAKRMVLRKHTLKTLTLEQINGLTEKIHRIYCDLFYLQAGRCYHSNIRFENDISSPLFPTLFKINKNEGLNKNNVLLVTKHILELSDEQTRKVRDEIIEKIFYDKLRGGGTTIENI
jgi:hypothetical protein